MSNGLFIQSLGLVGLGLSFVIYQLNHRQRMLLVGSLSSVFWTIHYLLLGAPTGSAINFLISVRNLVFYKAGKNRSVLIPMALASLFTLAVVMTWQGPRSLLPLGGSLTGTLAFWQVHPRHIRMIVLSSTCLWLTYNILSKSYAGIAADAIVLLSIVIGIYRFDIRPSMKHFLKLAYQKLK
ncbi:MAG: hypothetical protein UX30_C0007G0120 [Candidatus Saccharibacteria bacterium GW2011_GWA2_46_10]|nr:MAG: hypothetical protein UX30_C0007G0120 [Candidatus Saccharibacteria bacterium GW2011_GWA2_46_10]